MFALERFNELGSWSFKILWHTCLMTYMYNLYFLYLYESYRYKKYKEIIWPYTFLGKSSSQINLETDSSNMAGKEKWILSLKICNLILWTMMNWDNLKRNVRNCKRIISDIIQRNNKPYLSWKLNWFKFSKYSKMITIESNDIL